MDTSTVKRRLLNAVETLASVEHERWAHWQRHMHSLATRKADGCLLIPAEHAQRWERLMRTPYAQLGEAEKQSDRDQVYKYLPIIEDALLRD